MVHFPWHPMAMLVITRRLILDLWLIYLVKMVVFYSYVSHNQSYGHLPVMTGYKWDYTFYKWGFVSTYN
jgi:hypothetical protein